MEVRKFILKETLLLALGEIVCLGAMFGVFAMFDRFDLKVVLGGVIGVILALLNFFFLAIMANRAADKAEAQDVKGGKATIKASFWGRMFGLIGLLVLFALTGKCNTLAMVVPVLLGSPIIIVIEFLRKSGGTTHGN